MIIFKQDIHAISHNQYNEFFKFSLSFSRIYDICLYEHFHIYMYTYKYRVILFYKLSLK